MLGRVYLHRETDKDTCRLSHRDRVRDTVPCPGLQGDGYSLTPHLNKLKTVHPSPDRPSWHTRANSTHISEHYSVAAC